MVHANYANELKGKINQSYLKEVQNHLKALRSDRRISMSTASARLEAIEFVEERFVKLYNDYASYVSIPPEIYRSWIMMKTYKVLLEILDQSIELKRNVRLAVKRICDSVFLHLVDSGLYA